MTRRFDGAITMSEEALDSTTPPVARRLDAFVFVAIARNRPWFDWAPPSGDRRR